MSAPAYMPMPLPPSPPHHFNHAMMSMGMPLMDYGGVALNPVAADASPEVIVTEKHGMAPTSTTSAGGSQPDETTHVEMQGATAAAVVAVQE